MVFTQPYKLLISAYGCEPGKGSEQGVGWNWVLQLAKLAELVVITRSNNRNAIEKALPAELAGRIQFVYYDLPDGIRRFKRKEKGLYGYYWLWQWGAYRCARRLLGHHSFDYVMHLTFGSIWMPTFMHRLPVPFIWGPVGGGEAVPWRLIGSLPARGRAIQYLRYLLMATFRWNPLFAGIIRRSRVILARTGDTAKLFPAGHSGKVRTILETAVADEWLQRPPKVHDGDLSRPVRVVYTGRLVPFKNVGLAIRAVALARRHGIKVHFTIVGDGPLRRELQALTEYVGVAEAVTFTGRCTQEEVLDYLSASDVYLLPSLREGGVWSLMEAMAIGLPSICINTSGMAVIADTDSARLVDPTEPSQMVEDFGLALRELAASPAIRKRMGGKARQRIEQHFRWEQKEEFMASLFDELEHPVS